jgi:hypothetical protein
MMNLALELVEDRSQERTCPPKEYEVVSLLEMVPFCVDLWLRMFHEIGHVAGMDEAIQSVQRTVHECFVAMGMKNKLFEPSFPRLPSPEPLLVALVVLQQDLIDMGLNVTAANVRDIVEFISDTGYEKFSELKPSLDGFMKVLENELSTKIVMMIPSDKQGYFDGSKISLSEVARRKFPQAQKELDEASKCFAFKRYVACVFHLMRVMEEVVQKLGRKFKIPRYHRKTWGKILNKMKDNIDQMPEGTPKQKIKKQRYFYTYDLLHSVCEGIRNPLVHPKISEIELYREEEVENLLNRVKTFINDFAVIPR